MENQTARLWEVCIHESGHALAALLLGVEGIGCCVFEEDGVSGTTTKTPDTATAPKIAEYDAGRLDAAYACDSIGDLLRDAVWTAAGRAAVDLLLHPEITETRVEGGDFEMIAAAARAAFPGNDFYVQMNFAYLAAARARCLLKPVLWRVKLVAKALLVKRRLTAEEVALSAFPGVCRNMEEVHI